MKPDRNTEATAAGAGVERLSVSTTVCSDEAAAWPTQLIWSRSPDYA